MNGPVMSHKKHSSNLDVRRLHSVDQVDICDHFLRLDDQSRRARFCGATSDWLIEDYAHKCFDRQSIVCGAYIDSQLRGLVELRAVHKKLSKTAEAAFSVERDWQNLGIGDALFGHMLIIAQNRGIGSIQMMCLRDNNRMQHLAIKHHALLDYDQHTIAAVLRPDWPTMASLAKEVAGETRGYAHHLFGRR